MQTVEIKKSQIDWSDLPKRFMNEGELETLVTLFKSVKPLTVIEFGINTGRTAKVLLREISSIEHYIGVDVLPGYQTAMRVQKNEVPSVAGEMVKDDPRVKLIVTANGSHDLTSDDLPECNAVFIDGDHSRAGVMKDTDLARALIRKGGIIIWHDYHDLRTVQVKEVIDEYVSQGYDIKHVKNTWLVFQKC
jgi:predicted O-methyltransferase YrrM